MAGSRILLVSNDKELMAELKEKIAIDTGYSLSVESGNQAAIESFKDKGFDIVIIKFDTQYDKIELVRELRRIDPDVIIIAYTDEYSDTTPKDIPHLGIYDFITKSINEEKLSFLIRKGIELRSLTLTNRKLIQSLHEHNSSLQKQNTLLAKRIEESTKNLTRLYEDLRSTYMRTIKALAHAIDARDHYTHSHSKNVARFAVAIAEEMHLSAKDIEIIREACELHDLGKIGIQDDILIKPSELDSKEWELMKQHPLTGAQILEPLTFLHGVIDLIRQHHEHYDGSGYPQGLKGEDILLGARIIHLADAYEAMTSARSYRKVPFSKEEAIAEIKRNSGTQFDPKVVEAFFKAIKSL